MENKKYIGSCYIGVVGSENENGECRDSIQQIRMREGDEFHGFNRATKGYEARQAHLNNWYNKTNHPFMFLLDHDMKFPDFALERMRSHELPYVSGAYMRRRFNPMCPVWFEQGKLGEMPMRIFTRIPESDKLEPAGASGWGCILLHRDVVTEVKKLLKGEPEIIEDSMELYPYDLDRVMAAIRNIQNDPASSQNILMDEIRPLRGKKDIVGSDIRFPFYARLAGFDLFVDTGVRCQHMLNYPLDVQDYIIGMNPENLKAFDEVVQQEYETEKTSIEKRLAELSGNEN